jgi:hypothetical protein
MQDQPLGTVHLDGDVFLFNSDILRGLMDEDWDVLVQHMESPKNTAGVYWIESTMALEKCNKPQWAKPHCDAMYNCGIVCIKNEELKKEYFDSYWKMYDEFSKKGLKISCVPDIIIEQQYLVDLCEARGYKVKTILPETRVHETARSIGYSHLIGNGKFHHLKKVLKCIYKYDKIAYEKLKQRYYGREIFEREWPY